MTLFRAVLVIDVLLALFPPLHWWVSSDSPGPPLLYFVGSSGLIVASLFLLAALAPRDRDTDVGGR